MSSLRSRLDSILWTVVALILLVVVRDRRIWFFLLLCSLSPTSMREPYPGMSGLTGEQLIGKHEIHGG